MGALLVAFSWMAVIFLSKRRTAVSNDALDVGLLAWASWVVAGLCWSTQPLVTLGAVWRIAPGLLAFFAARRCGYLRSTALLSGLAIVAGVLASGALVELAGRELCVFPAPLHWQAIGRAHWPLTNPDHLAYLLEGMAPFAFLAYVRRPSLAGLLNALVLMSALAATLSGSGPAALLVVAVVLGRASTSGAGQSVHTVLRGDTRRRVMAVALAFVVMAPYWLLGTPGVLTRGDPVGERFLMWRAGWHAWLERPLTGFGFGCFNRAMGPHQNWLQRVDYTYAHSCLVEWAVTTGVVGALLALFCLACWLRKTNRRSWQTRAAMAGCCVMLLHECFDFGLLETAGSCWFGFLAGLALARDTTPFAVQKPPFSRWRLWWNWSLAPMCVLLLAAIAGVMCAFRSGPDLAFTSTTGSNLPTLLRVAAQDPRNPDPLLDAAEQALKDGESVHAEQLVRLALARNPGLAQSRLALAETLLRQGYRDTVRQTIQPLIPFYAGLPDVEKREARDEIDRLAALMRAVSEK